MGEEVGTTSILFNYSGPELRVACASDSHVLLRGATGTGKSRLAIEIHAAGPRRDRPFVAINLAALHEGTLESELFGHERGAFTGAERARVGHLALAEGGTVFLDEIGELSLKLQARLLEFLQSRKITPVGGNQARALNVRVISATHQDLEAKVARGEFREDLFHRLRVVTLRLPSLRERPESLDRAVHSVLSELTRENRKPLLRISEEVADLFERHPLPGNFRELRNALEFAIHACRSDTLQLEDLPRWFRDSCELPSLLPSEASRKSLGAIAVAEVPLTLNFDESLARFEAMYLAYVLERFKGRINLTAREIGLSKTTLIRRIRTHQLRPKFLKENIRVNELRDSANSGTQKHICESG
jgi:DNA-binding NtrC family response regulator